MAPQLLQSVAVAEIDAAYSIIIAVQYVKAGFLLMSKLVNLLVAQFR